MLQKLIDAIGLSKYGVLVLISLVLIWISLVVVSGAGWNPGNIGWDFSNPGAFGDSFGPLNTMMTALAALGAIAAFRAQTREADRAKARQEEQDVIAASDRERFVRREIQAEKRQEKATFETTFFKLLESFRAIVGAVDISTRQGGTKSAHDAYQIILNRMDYLDSSYENPRQAWSELSEQYINDLNHYFRFLYHIILFVDCSHVEDRYFYVRLVRAMLSEAEIVLLALNCEYGEGREKFKELVEKYSLLHNISTEAKRRWHLENLYSEAAFSRLDSEA